MKQSTLSKKRKKTAAVTTRPCHAKGTKVFNREMTEQGELTGSSRLCSMDGCTGRRLGVRWPDGKLTWPCAKGMLFDPEKNQWVIR